MTSDDLRAIEEDIGGNLHRPGEYGVTLRHRQVCALLVEVRRLRGIDLLRNAEVIRLRALIEEHNRSCTPECYEIS